MVAGQICNRMNMDTGNLQVCMDDLKNLFGERATIYSKIYRPKCYSSKVVLGSG